MKKFFVLAISIVTLSLASCGSGTSTQVPATTTDTTKHVVKCDSTKAACCVKKDSVKAAVKVDTTKKK